MATAPVEYVSSLNFANRTIYVDPLSMAFNQTQDRNNFLARVLQSVLASVTLAVGIIIVIIVIVFFIVVYKKLGPESDIWQLVQKYIVPADRFALNHGVC